MSTFAANCHVDAGKFDVDDAFADGDEPDMSHNFTSAALRAELQVARGFSHIDQSALEENNSNGAPTSSGESFAAPNDSVSTIDIHFLERRTSLPLRPSDSFATISDSVSSQLSHVSLSDEPLPSSPEAVEPEEVKESYPSVYIDVSEGKHPHVLEVRNMAPTSSPSMIPEFSRTYTPLETSFTSTNSDGVIPATPSGTASIHPSSSTPKHAQSSTSTRHRPTRSAGPSVLETVISKTRPTYLPPKARDEDLRHLADWELMMKQSRVIELKKRQAREQRRISREQRAEESLYIWEKEILPDWRVVNKNPLMRKLWWQGIPTKMRAVMWDRAVGNALALGKDSFRTCLARARRALSAGTFPTTTLLLMDQDIRSTLPTLHLFHPETGAMYGDLKDMLCAWVVARSDEGLGYTMGISRIAAMFVLNMPLPEGFVAMRNLLDRHCLRSFYGGLSAKDDVEAYYRIFDTLLADAMPKIYFNFKQHQLSPASYLSDWLIPIFLDHLDFEVCAHLWDILLLDGDSFIYRVALAILAALEPRLFFPDRKELLELLKGENKASLEVAKRERIPLDGPKYDIYGLDEEILWEKIDSMDGWWKDSTWTRLVSRELPDL